MQVCQVFDEINKTCSLSASVIDKRSPSTIYVKHDWTIFFLVDRDLTFVIKDKLISHVRAEVTFFI